MPRIRRPGRRLPAVRLVAVLAALFVIVPSAAYAYIDPGTGSFVIQGIIAAVVGAGVVLRMFWSRIKRAVTGKDPEIDDDA